MFIKIDSDVILAICAEVTEKEFVLSYIFNLFNISVITYLVN